jgi:hypothetical protein
MKRFACFSTARFSTAFALAGVAAFASLAGCTAPITIDVKPEEARLVIYSTIMDEEVYQEVTVQRTVPFFSNQSASLVHNATVVISTSEGDVYPALWDHLHGSYVTASKFAAKPGVTYTLDVAFDFNSDGTPEHYSATTTALEPRIELEELEMVPTMLFGDIYYRMELTANEPAGKDFYVLRVVVNGTTREYGIIDWNVQDDRIFEGGRLEGMTIDMFEEGAGSSNMVNAGDWVTLVVSNVDEGFFNFISDAQAAESKSTNPLFGGPPYNMRTNISGGAIGYFGSLCSTRISASVPAVEVIGH